METRLRAPLVRCLCVVSMLLAWVAATAGEAAAPAEVAGAPLDLVCAPARPVVHPGESVKLRAWLTDGAGRAVVRGVDFTWSASSGTLTGTDNADWTFGPADAGADGAAKATARLVARHASLGEARCEVVVYVAGADAAQPGPDRSAKLGARWFLLPDSSPPAGYGLYSYLLFRTPPGTDEARERYRKAVESYLLVVQPLEEMERHRRRSELDIVMLPLKHDVELPADLSDPKQAASVAQQFLAAYDYARAQEILADLEIDARAYRSGPYLVSTLPADAGAKEPLLVFDMSSVVPKLVWDWVSAFCSISAQQRSWGGTALTKLALNTRNALAVSAGDTPEVVAALKDWIQLVKTH
jgi:hypothetical protein